MSPSRHMTTHYLACDLGAESGRLMLGSLEDGRLSLEELHRFPNGPVKSGASLHWDIPRLFAELKTGLKEAARRNLPIASISTDSWGLDYMLFSEDGALMGPTFHYRDGRTGQGSAVTLAKVDWKTIFEETGIQFMALNTLYQLAAESRERLQRARHLLLIGDGFNFLLSGEARAEETLASTSQLYNPRTRTWSRRLLDALELPERLFPPIVPAGSRLGALKDEIARETGLWGLAAETPGEGRRDACPTKADGLEVIAGCSHDTGAAVVAVPACGEGWAYLSSGTWSLIGVELTAPILTDACRELNFTNEIGFGGSVRLLKNIVGLWLVQECRRDWAQAGQRYDYETLTNLAAEAQSFTSLINPADPRFVSPEDMPARIAAFCRETGQPVPATPGATIRCVLESLALLYRSALSQIERLVGKKIERLHIVGGGSRNALLNQFTANALQIPVLAGPVEATAAGNILVQAITLGHLPSLAAARAVVRASSELRRFDPSELTVWERAFERFRSLIGS